MELKTINRSQKNESAPLILEGALHLNLQEGGYRADEIVIARGDPLDYVGLDNMIREHFGPYPKHECVHPGRFRVTIERLSDE